MKCVIALLTLSLAVAVFAAEEYADCTNTMSYFIIAYHCKSKAAALAGINKFGGAAIKGAECGLEFGTKVCQVSRENNDNGIMPVEGVFAWDPKVKGVCENPVTDC